MESFVRGESSRGGVIRQSREAPEGFPAAQRQPGFAKRLCFWWCCCISLQRVREKIECVHACVRARAHVCVCVCVRACG
jgi:hypothetical protein